MKERGKDHLSEPAPREEGALAALRKEPAREASLGLATTLGLGKGCSNTSVYEEQGGVGEKSLQKGFAQDGMDRASL